MYTLKTHEQFLNLPIVWELELEAGVVSRFYGDDVGAEVRSEEEAEGLDDVGALGLTPRQAQLGELFVWAEHDQLWSKDNPAWM